MPIYEYACDKCGHEFELEQRITEDPVKTCPACRSRKVKRLISQTSFVLKGGGWYSDLYSSGGAKKDKGTDAEKDKGETQATPVSADDKTDKKKSGGDDKGKTERKTKKGKGPKAA